MGLAPLHHVLNGLHRPVNLGRPAPLLAPCRRPSPRACRVKDAIACAHVSTNDVNNNKRVNIGQMISETRRKASSVVAVMSHALSSLRDAGTRLASTRNRHRRSMRCPTCQRSNLVRTFDFWNFMHRQSHLGSCFIGALLGPPEGRSTLLVGCRSHVLLKYACIEEEAVRTGRAVQMGPAALLAPGTILTGCWLKGRYQWLQNA